MFEVDWFAEELSGTQFTCLRAGVARRRHRPLSSSLGDWEPMLDLAKQIEPVHPWHVDVGQHRQQFGRDFLIEELEGLIARLGDVQHIGAWPRRAPEALPEQLSDIGCGPRKSAQLRALGGSRVIDRSAIAAASPVRATGITILGAAAHPKCSTQRASATGPMN